MRFNPKARIGSGQVSDAGGAGGGSRGGLQLPIPGGSRMGGGIGGIAVVLLIVILSQCMGANLPGVPGGDSGDNANGGGNTQNGAQEEGTGTNGNSGDDRYAECQTGEDANKSADCARKAVVLSIQNYWTDALPQQAGRDYQKAPTRTFTGQVDTGCGAATSQVGPFYCPRDSTIYLDTGFFDEVLEKQLGGPDGGFVEAYVIGHEYGHHIQNLMGTMGKVRTQQGPESDAVRLELQADCYGGMWAKAASETQDDQGVNIFAEGYPSEEDITLAIEAAETVGDDRIQEKTSGRVNPEGWTHGSAEQRRNWFNVGYEQGDYNACDTFSANEL